MGRADGYRDGEATGRQKQSVGLGMGQNREEGRDVEGFIIHLTTSRVHEHETARTTTGDTCSVHSLEEGCVWTCPWRGAGSAKEKSSM